MLVERGGVDAGNPAQAADRSRRATGALCRWAVCRLCPAERRRRWSDGRGGDEQTTGTHDTGASDVRQRHVQDGRSLCSAAVAQSCRCCRLCIIIIARKLSNYGDANPSSYLRLLSAIERGSGNVAYCPFWSLTLIFEVWPWPSIPGELLSWPLPHTKGLSVCLSIGML